MKKKTWIFYAVIVGTDNCQHTHREDLEFDEPVKQGIGYARMLDIYSGHPIVEIVCLNCPTKF